MYGDRSRLIVLTDIGGDPDDEQSLVRRLTYANEFDIEGLAASASGTPGELGRAVTRPDLIRENVAACGEVHASPRAHDPAYPSPAALAVPRDASGTEIHAILEVAAGDDPPLTSYRRAVIRVE
jgi:hypothetical protein